MLQSRNVVEHPFAVAPPEPPSGVVVIVGLVGELVVVTVQGDPVDGTALGRQGSHQHQHPFQPTGHLKAAMGHEAVQAEGDPKHCCPVEDDEGDHALPAPELREQRHGGEDMHREHERCGAALQLALLPRQPFSGSHHRSADAQFAFGCGGWRGGGDQGLLL